MFQQMPDGWPGVEPATLRVALERAEKALDDDGLVVRRLAAYYRRDGDYAGATFLSLNPNDPGSISPSDLLAVTTLSVDIPPRAVRHLVEPGADANHVNNLLAAPELDPSIDLLTARTATVAKMSDLYEAVKAALAPAHVKRSDRWLTASKLCARRRPYLFPVQDTVVTTFLQTRDRESYSIDWQVYYALLDHQPLVERLEAAVDTAAREDGVDVGDRTALLRHLDVALWMYASKQPV